jgi:hypothetical protein
MGLISNTLMLGIGLGAGYVLWHPTTDNCKEMYDRKISVMEEKYASVPRQGLVGPRDVSIDYVVAEDEGVNGVVITHNRSGKQEVLVERQILFQDNYRLDLEPLNKSLSPDEKISLVGANFTSPKDDISDNYSQTADKFVDKLKDYAAKAVK